VPRGKKLSPAEVMRLALHEVEASLGDTRVDDTVPLWEPLPLMPGRGITMPDGRVLSPQQAAIETPADETFFGGAPGGGKTMLAIGLALTQHRNSIIFRRQFAQLRGKEGIIEKTREIVGTRGHFAGAMVTRLPGDRSIEFGSMQHEWDKEKYKGRPHDLKVFDEIPDFMESQYRYVIAWLRTAVPGQRVRVFCTGNPPTTEEGQWVVRYWAPWLDQNHPNPARSAELRWFIMDEEGKDKEVPGPGEYEMANRLVKARSRTFIAAQVEDNPMYMATDYVSVLDSLPEPLRSQMRFGNFVEGTGDAPYQVIPRAWVVAAQARWKRDGGAGLPLDGVGVDCSRGGQDEFVVTPKYGNWIGQQSVHSAKEAPDGSAGAQLIVKAIGLDQAVPVRIDVGGEAGPSVYDHLTSAIKEAGSEMAAVAMNGSRASKARDKTGKLGFINKRAEWHWRMREALDPDSGENLALPPDSQLRADLCAPRWKLMVNGKIQIESKKDIAKRLGRSPDRGESLIYACAAEGGIGDDLVLFASGASKINVIETETKLAMLKRKLGLR